MQLDVTVIITAGMRFMCFVVAATALFTTLNTFLLVLTLRALAEGSRKEDKILTALDDANAAVAKVQADITALTTAVGTAAAAISTENATIASLQQQIAALQAGGGATPDQLEAIARALGTASANIEAQTAALTAAATPPAASPAPAAPSAS